MNSVLIEEISVTKISKNKRYIFYHEKNSTTYDVYDFKKEKRILPIEACYYKYQPCSDFSEDSTLFVLYDKGRILLFDLENCKTILHTSFFTKNERIYEIFISFDNKRIIITSNGFEYVYFIDNNYIEKHNIVGCLFGRIGSKLYFVDEQNTDDDFYKNNNIGYIHDDFKNECVYTVIHAKSYHEERHVGYKLLDDYKCIMRFSEGYEYSVFNSVCLLTRDYDIKVSSNIYNGFNLHNKRYLIETCYHEKKVTVSDIITKHSKEFNLNVCKFSADELPNVKSMYKPIVPIDLMHDATHLVCIDIHKFVWDVKKIIFLIKEKSNSKFSIIFNNLWVTVKLVSFFMNILL